MTAQRSRRVDVGAVLAAAILARHASGYRHMRRTLRFLAEWDGDVLPAADRATVHVIVPMLREQSAVRVSVDWWAWVLQCLPGWTVTFVTSAREESERDRLAALSLRVQGPLTATTLPDATEAELAALQRARLVSASSRRAAARMALAAVPTTGKLLEDALDGLGGLPIRHAHYAGGGRKAAQVNFAARTVRDARPGPSYIAVYDADSRPAITDLTAIASLLGRVAAGPGSAPPIMQQSARFAVPDELAGGIGLGLCRSAATLQTLWTLRREIPSFRKYERVARRPSRWPAADRARRGLAQTVGHGLFVRRDIFDELGGLPEHTLLDDLPFGYRATIRAVPVTVVPYLETADAPADVGELIRQGRRWFGSYLDYLSMARETHEAGICSPAHQAITLSIAAYRAMAWLMSGPAALAAVVLVIRPGHPVSRTLAAAALWLGFVAPLGLLPELRSTSPWVRLTQGGELLAAGVLSSVGPFLALADARRRPAASRFAAKARRP